jgi:hypothetical protein
MSWSLLSLTICPPGEFIYTQSEGITRKFGPSPDIYGLSNTIAEFRRANKLSRGTADEALEDIVAYTCTRLGNHPRWCYNTDKTLAQLVPKRQTGGGCSTCGHK